MPSPAGPFDLNDPVLLVFPLTDIQNNPVNTTGTPVCTVTQPDGTTAAPGGVTNPQVGIYEVVYQPTQVGHHQVAWVASGTNPGGYTDSFDVWPTGDRSILSFADAKQTVNIPASVGQFDTELRQYNEAITDFVEYYCGPVIQRTVVEELPGYGMTIALSQTPCLALVNWAGTTSPMKPVMVYGVAYDISVLHLDPVLGIIRHTGGLPFFYGPYQIQYSAGRPIIPMAISMACRIIMKHLWAINRGGGAGSFGAGEEETNFEGFGFAVPNRALEMLEPHRSPGVAV
jgi:hypothetical protein